MQGRGARLSKHTRHSHVSLSECRELQRDRRAPVRDNGHPPTQTNAPPNVLHAYCTKCASSCANNECTHAALSASSASRHSPTLHTPPQAQTDTGRRRSIENQFPHHTSEAATCIPPQANFPSRIIPCVGIIDHDRPQMPTVLIGCKEGYPPRSPSLRGKVS